ncbi:MAG: hypothetical protein LBK82_00270 [Planctomycetaceae bacterium]|jgi:cell division protein FtsB|nr:hypothetical protein [Planctomycetaceae bacterium]
MDKFLRNLFFKKHLWYFQYHKLLEQKEFIDFIQEYNQHFGIETTDLEHQNIKKLESRIDDLESEINDLNSEIDDLKEKNKLMQPKG